VAAAARYFLGVDGGATQCRAWLRDSEGCGVAEAHAPAAHVYVDCGRRLKVVVEFAEHTTGMHRVEPEMKIETALGLGLAGITSELDTERIEASLAGWARVSAVNDAVAACVGAGLGDGGLIIAGASAAGIAGVGGAAKIIGGGAGEGGVS
jgi:glucosamine kinase